MDGWGIGIATLALIACIAVGYANAVFEMQERERTKQAQKRKMDAWKVILAQQAADASRRAKAHHDGLPTEKEWISKAVDRILQIWPTMDRDRAWTEIKGAMEVAGMRFGDPDYDWSYDAAIEFAEEYARECGEVLSNA